MVTRAEQIVGTRKSVSELEKLVSTGEGSHLEFKKKATYPEKIVQEMIAFANTNGGYLLLGVDDDKTLSGLRFPEEEIHILNSVVAKHCRPKFEFTEEIIPISAKKYIIKYHIPQSKKRPHHFVDRGMKSTYVREKDKCIKASRELREIIRRSKSEKGVRFSFGNAEKILMQHLQKENTITLSEFKSLADISRHMASRKLVLLALANVIKVTPTERGDVYSLVGR